jgi:hypothetical protein
MGQHRYSIVSCIAHTLKVAQELGVVLLVGDIVQNHQQPVARGADGRHRGGKQKYSKRKK